jgi:hypothetical protein
MSSPDAYNPPAFHLTAGQFHDLESFYALIALLEAEAVLVDKVYDVEERG